ncbi:MAG: WbqC family protein [Bacteroidales bacterium]|nr:WbqC family protein [Bacteroidales bacterium]
MAIPDKAILSTSYLGPLQYFSKFLLHGSIVIEQCENYQKQSYRNRCCIYGANGAQSLVIPVSRTSDDRISIRDVTIDYSQPWQKIHWKSIESAYRLSPCFEFYEDELIRYYEKSFQVKYLFDWNMELMEVILSMLKVPVKFSFTSGYEKHVTGLADYREAINPKKRLFRPDRYFVPKHYPQVFENKHGFLPNLSIIDLLFNEGRHAKDVLEEGIVE